MNKINGQIYMTKTLPEGKEIKISKKNSLTKVFENSILATAIGGLLSSAMGSEAGVASVNTSQRYTSNSTSVKMTSDSATNSFVIYLLNLPAEVLETVNADMTTVPILDNAGKVIEDYVVGWAPFNYYTGEGKKGTLTSQKAVYTVNPEQFGVSFNWTAGKLDGSVNCVMLAANVIENPRTGITLSKGLDINNVVIGENPADGHYLTNNVSLADGTVITGQNEILLGNGSNASVGRRVLNLLTGETTDLDTTDVRYGCYLFNVPHAYIGEGRIVQNSGSAVSVVNYNGSSTTLNKNLVSSNARGFAIANNNVYVCDMSSTSAPKIKVFDMETLTTSTDNDIALTFPSDMGTVRNWDLSNFHDKFMFINTAGAPSTYPTNGNEGFVFTDITSPFTSYVGSYTGFIGSNLQLIDENENLTQYIYLTEFQVSNLKKGVNNDYCYNPSGTTTTVARNGIKYVAEGYNGQVLTFAKLDTPEVFTGVENFRIDYMFNF